MKIITVYGAIGCNTKINDSSSEMETQRTGQAI